MNSYEALAHTFFTVSGKRVRYNFDDYEADYRRRSLLLSLSGIFLVISVGSLYGEPYYLFLWPIKPKI